MRYLDLAEVVALAAEVSEVEAGKLVELLRDYLVAVTRYPSSRRPTSWSWPPRSGPTPRSWPPRAAGA